MVHNELCFMHGYKKWWLRHIANIILVLTAHSSALLALLLVAACFTDQYWFHLCNQYIWVMDWALLGITRTQKCILIGSFRTQKVTWIGLSQCSARSWAQQRLESFVQRSWKRSNLPRLSHKDNFFIMCAHCSTLFSSISQVWRWIYCKLWMCIRGTVKCSCHCVILLIKWVRTVSNSFCFWNSLFGGKVKNASIFN